MIWSSEIRLKKQDSDIRKKTKQNRIRILEKKIQEFVNLVFLVILTPPVRTLHTEKHAVGKTDSEENLFNVLKVSLLKYGACIYYQLLNND